MNTDFSAAMARATSATRASNIAEATRIIGEALGLRAPRDDGDAPVGTPAEAIPIDRAAGAGPAFRRRAGQVEDAELVTPAKDQSKDQAGGQTADQTADPAASATARGWAPLRTGAPWRAGRGLGETTRLLREGRRGLWPGVVGDAASTAGPAIAEGARFDARRFASAEGTREYRLYVPSPAAGTPRGLVLMLHGCKQNPEDFALGTGMNDQAEAEGLILVYPRQTAAQNASSCWNWFRSSDQARDRGEPAILAGMVREVAEEFGIAPDRCFVAGLSAGGAMAAVVSEVYPDVFAAAGIHSGIPTGAASDVVSAFAAMRGDAAPARVAAMGRRIVFHGVDDRTVHPANAGRLLPEDAQAGRRVVGKSDGGRVYQRIAQPGVDGATRSELWLIEGAGHAWSGGKAGGSYTDPAGPDASAEMVRFFLGRS